MNGRPPPKFLLAKIGIGALASLIFLFGTDMAVFAGIGKDYFNLPGMRPEPDIGMMTLGYVLGSLIFAYLYAKWEWIYTQAYPVWKVGAIFGSWIGMVAFLPKLFFDYALFDNWDFQVLLVGFLFRIVQFALMGVLVAYILGKNNVWIYSKKDSTGNNIQL